MASRASAVEWVSVEGRELKLTSLDRVVYPPSRGRPRGFTKRDVLAYYAAIAPAMLPHLKDRAVETRRYPDGVLGAAHWQRDLPPRGSPSRPAWLQAARVHAETRGGDIEYPHLVDLASLMWAANQNMLEFHAFLARYPTPRKPTMLVFDLDPGEGRDVVDCADVALVIRDVLDGEGLRAFPKTSGGKGLQLFVPLNGAQPELAFAETKAFARQLAEGFELLQPGRITSKVAKAARKGKVLIDWGQNERNHLMVAAYSLRARVERPQPTVSAPLVWREVERIAEEADASLARITPEDALDRVRRGGDPFAPVQTLRQRLPF